MAARIDVPALAAAGATLLCVGAHADDLEIAAGGTIGQLVRRFPGLRVVWLVLTADDSRRREAQASASAIVASLEGAKLADEDLIIHDLPDGRLPATWLAVKDALEAVKDVDPALILAPHRHDRHQDHRLVGEVVWQTFRNHLVWEYEIPKYEGDLGHPNVYIPLSDQQVEAKVHHLLAHFPSQHGRQWYDEDLFRAVLRLRGVEAGVRWAEAFHAPKMLLGG